MGVAPMGRKTKRACLKLCHEKQRKKKKNPGRNQLKKMKMGNITFFAQPIFFNPAERALGLTDPGHLISQKILF